MRRHIAIAVAVASLLTGCSTVPYTNRSQLVLISESEEAQLGAQAFQQATKGKRIVRGTRAAAQVEDVGRRLAAVSGQRDFHWQFALLEGKDVNAFALPGGKTAVYTGLLPVAVDTNGLAVVMGHEIAHAIARHGAERMSQGVLVELGGAVVGAAAGQNAALAMAAYGLGSQLGIMLPFSRSHESEADRIGLILMARAGYDPRGALAFWDRMEAQQRGGSPPEFLSTHPGYETRRKRISDAMPEALQYYAVAPRAPVVPLE
ncbi:MAG TPA: M48 family metallopeptidase [Candidatus Limnocylindria bacterium]|nr:M48 family metallopeptidase [Candidatus Limnocylindria bacterium]